MKDVSFGQYYPVDSFVHKVDPRLKILFLIGYIVAIFLAKNFYGLAVCAFVLLLVILFSRVPILKVLRAVKGILFLVIFTAALNILFNRSEEVYWAGPAVYWRWKIFSVTQGGIVVSLFLVARLILLVTLSSMLTYTTTPVALTDGLESLLTPLKWMHIPVYVLADVMSIALRFIPELSAQTERIADAQKSRGASLDSGGPVKRVKAFVPVLVPLFLAAFRIADDLGEAMESRCYMSGRTRTKYKKMHFTWRDLLVFLLLGGMIAGVVLLRIYIGGIL